VENNTAALLIVGGLALILAAVILLKGRSPESGNTVHWWVIAGFSGALLLWTGGLVALAVSVDWLASNAHYIAASSLGLCILVVVGANARRHQDPDTRENDKNLLLKYRYTWIAVIMLAGAGALIGLWQTGVISLFWVEISVAFMFILFWIVQTIELWNVPESGTEGQPGVA
jgi:small-conductance mechanosensitive channel